MAQTKGVRNSDILNLVSEASMHHKKNPDFGVGVKVFLLMMKCDWAVS